MIVKAIVASIWSIGLLSPSFAADKYEIDPAHVSVNFSMQHDKWAKYQGTVRTIHGEIVFDREDLAKSSVSVSMATTSVDTLHSSRDAELQGFMHVREFPKITFQSTSVEKTGDKTGKI